MVENAASVSSRLLTTEPLIADLPEEKPAAVPPMPHGDFEARQKAPDREGELFSRLPGGRLSADRS